MCVSTRDGLNLIMKRTDPAFFRWPAGHSPREDLNPFLQQALDACGARCAGALAGVPLITPGRGRCPISTLLSAAGAQMGFPQGELGAGEGRAGREPRGREGASRIAAGPCT